MFLLTLKWKTRGELRSVAVCNVISQYRCVAFGTSPVFICRMLRDVTWVIDGNILEMLLDKCIFIEPITKVCNISFVSDEIHLPVVRNSVRWITLNKYDN